MSGRADQQADLRGAEGPDRPADGSVSRPSKNNRPRQSEGGESADSITPREVPGPARRPVSVREGTDLRAEARLVIPPDDWAEPVPLHLWQDEVPLHAEVQARQTHRVVEEWRRWMLKYRNSHIEFEDPDGETVRAPLENSYQEGYADRYYARIKDLERGINRQYEGLTTVMLTFTASHKNAEGNWRCPADHMRDVIGGWNTARKELHRVLDGYRWEYARILEPHKDGYGHLHIGVFVEDLDGEITAGDFRSVMGAHVRGCESAGIEAHRNAACSDCETPTGDCADCDTPVSVSSEVENLGSYLSEYIGMYGEDALSRPMYEQTFYAITWATNTRRVDFSNGAQEIIAGEEFRRETGLRPCDRGETETDSERRETGAQQEDEPAPGEGADDGWSVRRLCEVQRREPNYHDPTSGGVSLGPIDGRPGMDPPRNLGAPPPD